MWVTLTRTITARPKYHLRVHEERPMRDEIKMADLVIVTDGEFYEVHKDRSGGMTIENQKALYHAPAHQAPERPKGFRLPRHLSVEHWKSLLKIQTDPVPSQGV